MSANEGSAAVVLLSGGLDSSTTLALAAEAGHVLHALSFAYGQRHEIELASARRQAQRFSVRTHEIVDLTAFGAWIGESTSLSARSRREVSDHRSADGDAIPDTYVPARNTVFLAYALARAETLDAGDLWIGVNAVDYSGYPDCRPEFIAAFERLANLATRAGVEGREIRVRAPLLSLHKHEIIAEGRRLDVDFSDTVSCYRPTIEGSPTSPRVLACGSCESCELRRRGFERAGGGDPTTYRR